MKTKNVPVFFMFFLMMVMVVACSEDDMVIDDDGNGTGMNDSTNNPGTVIDSCLHFLIGCDTLFNAAELEGTYCLDSIDQGDTYNIICSTIGQDSCDYCFYDTSVGGGIGMTHIRHSCISLMSGGVAVHTLYDSCLNFNDTFAYHVFKIPNKDSVRVLFDVSNTFNTLFCATDYIPTCWRPVSAFSGPAFSVTVPESHGPDIYYFSKR